MKKQFTISESEIKRQLAGLKEEVAAPRDFRASVIKRLAEQTGQAVPESQASLWRRMLDFAARPMLLPAMGAAAALMIGFWIAARPAPQSGSPAGAPAAAAAKPVVAALKPSHPAKVMVAKAKPAPAAPQAEQHEQLAGQQQAAPALGGDAGKTGGSQSQFSASAPAGPVGAAGNPTATPGSSSGEQPLSGSSQVRRNRFLASRGEYAAILFKLAVPGRARVEIYDRLGKRIAVLHDADDAAGTFEVRWYGHEDNGQLAPTGIYLLRISAGEYHDSHKIVLVR